MRKTTTKWNLKKASKKPPNFSNNVEYHYFPLKKNKRRTVFFNIQRRINNETVRILIFDLLSE